MLAFKTRTRIVLTLMMLALCGLFTEYMFRTGDWVPLCSIGSAIAVLEIIYRLE